MSRPIARKRRRPLPIGVRWTLRFTLVMMVVLLAVGFFQYRQLQDHIRSDARLLMELQANEIQEAAERDPWTSDGGAAISAYVDQHIESAGPDVELGIRVWNEDGQQLLQRGSFESVAIPPPGPRDRRSSARIRSFETTETPPFVILTAPIEQGWVEIAIDDSRFIEAARDMRNSFLLALPAALLISGLLSFWLARGSLIPISQITDSARRITASQLEEEIPVSGNGDELDQLAETLNEMIARIGVGVARLRSFSGKAAHQLRTPISRLRHRLETAKIAPRDAKTDQEMLDLALGDISRLSAVVTGMLRLAESETGLLPEQRRRVELAPLLDAVVQFFEPIASEKGVALSASTIPDVRVEGDPEWLTEMFSNLVDNAIKFTPSGGRVELELRREGKAVRIEIRDTGCGFSLAESDATTSSGPSAPLGDGRLGPGLGLPIAREIARAHKGRISVESLPQPPHETSGAAGSRAVVRLPLV